MTNDIFTKEDGEFLVKHGALPEERIRAVETGGCPHAAIREDISINLGPLEELSNLFKADILLCESGGGNLEKHACVIWKSTCVCVRMLCACVSTFLCQQSADFLPVSPSVNVIKLSLMAGYRSTHGKKNAFTRFFIK